MATPPPSADGPRTEREFNTRLDGLIRAAVRNGVDVEGGWSLRTDELEQSDWGVEIYEVAKPHGPEPTD